MGVQVIKSFGLAFFFGLDFARKTCSAARLGFGRAVNNVYIYLHIIIPNLYVPHFLVQLFLR